MNKPTPSVDQINPFLTLGLTEQATEEQIRARYLELVKQFPPERAPEEFQKINAAYERARDPLKLAQELLSHSRPRHPPLWDEVIKQHAQQPPRLNPQFLLSLGNRPAKYRPPVETDSATDES